VQLIDRRNFHLFQPLLYQVATGGLSPANIAAPLRSLVGSQPNTEVWLDEVVDVDVANQRIKLRERELGYDTLVAAAGAGPGYFGHDDWARLAPGLKTIEDATEIRRRILLAFEAAEHEADAARRREWLTFVVVGGGPTGVELAGAISEIARYTLRHDFRNINPADANLIVVEADEHVLGHFPLELSKKAGEALERLHVTLRNGALVTDVQPDYVQVRRGDRRVPSRTRRVMGAAGVWASPLAAAIASAAGAQTDRGGRIIVEPDLTVPGHPEIFVIGDMARALDGDGKPLPGLAPVAIQQGKFVAKVIRNRLAGNALAARFVYRGRGNMATIGRSAAVVQLGRWKFGGFFAWLLWLFVHLMLLVQFENRLLVLIQWGWN
jgi:NADH dehydrogenase